MIREGLGDLTWFFDLVFSLFVEVEHGARGVIGNGEGTRGESRREEGRVD